MAKADVWQSLNEIDLCDKSVGYRSIENKSYTLIECVTVYLIEYLYVKSMFTLKIISSLYEQY